jgi:Tat protein secretion system quality control protein TatD with DNase activity
MARIAADRGYWLSFAGNVTFKNCIAMSCFLARAMCASKLSYCAGSPSSPVRKKSSPVYDRDAHDAVLDTLERVGAPERTVFHCFSGGADMARIAAERSAGRAAAWA